MPPAGEERGGDEDVLHGVSMIPGHKAKFILHDPTAQRGYLPSTEPTVSSLQLRQHPENPPTAAS